MRFISDQRFEVEAVYFLLLLNLRHVGMRSGIKRGLQQRRPQTTQPGLGKHDLSSFAPNISYAAYDWTFPEAMTSEKAPNRGLGFGRCSFPPC